VWLPTGDRTDEIADAFRTADIVVRPFSGDGIRISVGEQDSIEKVLRVAAATRG
jgi:histidinol-phosphate aminotransferase